jgi:DNA polymerase elongation subunit (family B)
LTIGGIVLFKVNNTEEIDKLKTHVKDGCYYIRSNNSGTLSFSDGDEAIIPPEFLDLLSEIIPKYDTLIYGKDQTEKIVSIAAGDSELYLYIEESPGLIKTVVRPLKRWILSSDRPRTSYRELEGSLHYRFMKEYPDFESFNKSRMTTFRDRETFYVVHNDVESAMIKDGYTLFKGMKIDEVSALSFDIETSGLNPTDHDALVFMISNTYKCGDKVERKLFAIDDFKGNEGAMLKSWIRWVNEKNPSLLIGHNVVSFDIPYLNTRAELNGLLGLELGRDGSRITFDKKPSKIRYDGSQSYDYTKCFVHGREIIDTWMLALKYDVSRNFPNYKLKGIIQHLGWQKEDRVLWDFEKISPMDLYKNLPKEKADWDRFKQYCSGDSDDSLRLFELMIPSFFYLTSYIPKPLQTVTQSASGAWLNSMMVRAYLQDNHSIPLASEREYVHGGISFGVPGIYKNVFKVDVQSMYPSIMRAFQIYPEGKDVKKYYPKIVEHFTLKRIEEKNMFKKTGDKYYDDLQAASKVVANSSFGMLSCSGLNFNDFRAGDRITGIGRQIIRMCLLWASGKDVQEYMKDYDIEKDERYKDVF